jgi:uncharacterized phiE125 gp8 family phage protein
MALKLITAPTEEPVTLTQVKLHCRVDGSDEDALLNLAIVAARRAAEGRTSRALVTQTWELALDAFPAAEIDLPMPPVQSITSVKYLDTSGVEQTIDAANYALDTYGMRPWLVPAYGYAWPASLASANAVKIRFVAGYGAAAAVPDDIKAWMLLAIGTLYANRETIATGQVAELPGGFWQSLLDPYRVFTF